MKIPDTSLENEVGLVKDEKNGNKLEKKLSEMIRYKKKFSTKKAKIIVTLDELKSFEKSMGDHEKCEWKYPQFFVQDLQRVILFSLIGNQYRFYPRWCKILRPNYIKRVNLITVNNLSEFDFQKNQKAFKKFSNIFKTKDQLNSIEFVSPFANGSTFIDEFASVPITRTQWVKIRDEKEFQIKQNEIVKKYRDIFKKLSTGKQEGKNAGGKDSLKSSTSELDKIPRTSILMNINQMVREDYPTPFDESGMHNLKDYVHTNSQYSPVTNESPIFSIDCEMCYNEDGDMETVWLAIVNESLDCVYETFIKPQKKILNYLSHITGVSASTFVDVTTTLADVQKKIQELLPPDAILCGQSLNNDLHSIKMFHPYIIDTSVIFNLSGNREIKPSLKRLSVQFLGKMIQEGSHNPSIDAKASLQLILLKLRQGIDFGDVIVNGCVNLYDDENIVGTINNMSIEDINLGDTRSISKFIYQTGLNIDQNIFNVLRDNKISNTYIDNSKYYKGAQSKFNSDTMYEQNSEAFKLINESLNKEKFIWTQLYVEKTDKNECDASELKKLLKSIMEVYANLEDDSLFMVAFTGCSNVDQIVSTDENIDKTEFHKGRCFLKHKCSEMDKLELEVKELYELVNSNK